MKQRSCQYILERPKRTVIIHGERGFKYLRTNWPEEVGIGHRTPIVCSESHSVQAQKAENSKVLDYLDYNDHGMSQNND